MTKFENILEIKVIKQFFEAKLEVYNYRNRIIYYEK